MRFSACSRAQVELGLMICLFGMMVQLEGRCMAANPGTGAGSGIGIGTANPAKILKNKIKIYMPQFSLFLKIDLKIPV